MPNFRILSPEASDPVVTRCWKYARHVPFSLPWAIPSKFPNPMCFDEKGTKLVIKLGEYKSFVLVLLSLSPRGINPPPHRNSDEGACIFCCCSCLCLFMLWVFILFDLQPRKIQRKVRKKYVSKRKSKSANKQTIMIVWMLKLVTPFTPLRLQFCGVCFWGRVVFCFRESFRFPQV